MLGWLLINVNWIGKDWKVIIIAYQTIRQNNKKEITSNCTIIWSFDIYLHFLTSFYSYQIY